MSEQQEETTSQGDEEEVQETPEYAHAPSHPMPGEEEDDEDDDDEQDEEQEAGDSTKDVDEEEKEMVSKLMANKDCPKRTCSAMAHNKMILHALKHLSSSVFGLLIGVTYKDEASSTYVHIMDVIPLQHTCFSAMLVEVAFLQIDEWLNRVCESTNSRSRNVRILGVYFANKHSDDVDKNTSAVLIALQLLKQYSRTSLFLCQVVPERINKAFAGEDHAVDWYMLRNHGNAENKRDWRDIEDVFIMQCAQKPNAKCSEQQYQEWFVNTKQLQSLDVGKQKFKQMNLAQMVQNNGEEKIYDFDDHLDDQSKDWRNFHLFQ